MLKICIGFILLHLVTSLFGSPRVPASYTFADIHLNITESARREIQTSVDALHRNRTYLDRKIEKIDLYFPIIERVLREEQVPEDFKYLVIQESALVADAVSSSNAVGFWQFKEVSAKEVGLRVDRYIDERMHITASTHAAAKYLKKNNYFFNNWVYALLAYNTGPGGAEKHIEKKYIGKKKMEINKRTHWYVKKFLAHMVAFENEIHRQDKMEFKLYEYEETKNKSLQEISKLVEIDYQTVSGYNKWLRRGNIPTDKIYPVIIPVTGRDHVALSLLEPNYKTPSPDTQLSKITFSSTYQPIAEFDFEQNEHFPVISTSKSQKVKVNGLPGFIATSDENVQDIASKHGISVTKFRKFNDLTEGEAPIPGKAYYLKRKRSKARLHFHVVEPGENAWSVSQKYGLRLNKLLTKNRMREEKDLKPGMVLWLRFIRPQEVPVSFRQKEENELLAKGIDSFGEMVPVPHQKEDMQRIESLSFESMESVAIDQDEFLFEEVDAGTKYIDENSYVTTKIDENKDKIVTNGEISTKKVKNEEIYHIVQPGETLFSIARKYDISVGQIRQWNTIDDLDVLTVGQRIMISSGNDTQVQLITPADEKKFNTYRVKEDDTLYSIARKHDMSIKQLMELNGKSDFNVQKGELLKVM